MVDELEKNSDGALSRQELLDSKILPPGPANWLFDYVDVDCSGKVTAKEIHNGLTKPGAPTSEEDYEKKK